MYESRNLIWIPIFGDFHQSFASYFAANAPTHVLGNTVLRDRLLSGAGFVVVSVTYREWDGKIEAEQEALLRARLRSAGVL